MIRSSKVVCACTFYVRYVNILTGSADGVTPQPSYPCCTIIISSRICPARLHVISVEAQKIAFKIPHLHPLHWKKLSVSTLPISCGIFRLTFVVKCQAGKISQSQDIVSAGNNDTALSLMDFLNSSCLQGNSLTSFSSRFYHQEAVSVWCILSHFLRRTICVISMIKSTQKGSKNIEIVSVYRYCVLFSEYSIYF